MNGLFYQIILASFLIVLLLFMLVICKIKPKRKLRYETGVSIQATNYTNSNIKTICLPKYEIEIYTKEGIKTMPLVMDGQTFLIGSGNDCDLCLADSEYVSEEHAEIFYDKRSQNYVLADLNSVNGLYTQDGRRIKEVEIRPDLQVNIANVRICFKKYRLPTKPMQSTQNVKTKVWKK